MRLVRRPITLAVAALLSSGSVAMAQQGASYPLTERGYGPVVMGMTQPEVEAALGIKLWPDDGEFKNCFETSAGTMYENPLPSMSFMFERGKLTRLGLHMIADGPQPEPRIVTDRGIGVHSTEADIRAIYGRPSKIKTSDFDDDWLIYWINPRKSGLAFRVDNRRSVVIIYAGTRSILKVDGCYKP